MKKTTLFKMNLQFFAEPDNNDPNDPINNPTDNSEPKPFNPNDLSEEALAYIDRERTRASQTASKNTKAKLENDPAFLASIKSKIEKENNLTVEEKLAQKENEINQRGTELAIRENTITVKDTLITAGFDVKSEGMDVIISLLADASPDISKSNSELFVTVFGKIVDSKVESLKQDLIQNGYEVESGTGGKLTLQQQMDKAKKDGDMRTATRIMRKAQEKGIVLK